jgi:hypothetical protein
MPLRIWVAALGTQRGGTPGIILTIRRREAHALHRCTNKLLKGESTMKRLSVFAILLLAVFTLFGCANRIEQSGWVTLIDGDGGLDNWNRIGDANWRSEGGAIVADKGKGGYLVSKNSYRDFEIYAEFYAESGTNSGIFIRATDPTKIGAVTAYEVNIWDTRPDPSYGTGAIVDLAKVNPMPRAGGKWNTYEIYAKGPQMTIKLNGVVTAHVQDSKNPAGPFALQYGMAGDNPGAVIKWRKVQVRAL